MPLRKRSQAKEVLRRVIALPIVLSVASGIVTICVCRDFRRKGTALERQGAQATGSSRTRGIVTICVCRDFRRKGTALERQGAQATGSNRTRGGRKAATEARSSKMEGRAGTALSGSAPCAGCRNAPRRTQSTLPLWKLPQVQEVLRRVISLLLGLRRCKWLLDGLCLS
jgi:hypothetical protein